MPDLPATSTQKHETACCIAGGGPAGMMLGFLLARAGVDVLVLEKHGDFLRDFRGDTIHPSTMEVMHELGLLDEFLKRPHQKMQKFEMQIGGRHVTFADCSHLPVHCPFIAFMPQWDFLNFLLEHASRLPKFRLKMQAEVTDLIEQDGRVVGVRAKTAEGNLEVRSALTVGADGRHSTVRRQAGLPVEDIGASIDVLWMRISRHPDDPHQLLGRFDRGRALIMIDRHDYWQCGFLIRKGGFEELKARGMPRFHEDLVAIAPFLRDRVSELANWDQVRLLTVAVDRLQTWSRPGLLCIGDAAHAMSPVGGVGINLAIQDAVATANILSQPLLEGKVTSEDLALVRHRRELPTRLTQRLQVFMHRRFLYPVLAGERQVSVPWFMKLMVYIPMMRRIPARIIGMGFRPEHVQVPAAMPH
jgi:2-polyprenyl-6-methoxyphenol hydroxylase-like FAD-dependent oxidoreductase